MHAHALDRNKSRCAQRRSTLTFSSVSSVKLLPHTGELDARSARSGAELVRSVTEEQSQSAQSPERPEVLIVMQKRVNCLEACIARAHTCSPNCLRMNLPTLLSRPPTRGFRCTCFVRGPRLSRESRRFDASICSDCSRIRRIGQTDSRRLHHLFVLPTRLSGVVIRRLHYLSTPPHRRGLFGL